MRQKKLRHIPVLDEQGCVVDLKTLLDMIGSEERENLVVLMAGGQGTRLRPLTNDCPKPMLKVSGKPVLEIILENFVEFGFKKFYISVNYQAHVVHDYFGDGSRFGVEIHYLWEKQELGTAGALSLLSDRPNSTLIVMNADLLTKVNFQYLLDFHRENHAKATMCVREYQFQVPYGVARVEGSKLYAIDEKPVHRFFVNAGIYVLEPSVLDLIPNNSYFDMPNLFEKLVEQGFEASVFPIREYWVDIGRMKDFEQAEAEYPTNFKE